MSDNISVQEVIAILSKVRFNLDSEKHLQNDIEGVLKGKGIEYKREHHLDKGSIIDFLIGDIGIEVKLKQASKRQMWAQCQRYSTFDEIGSIILLTNSAMGRPEFENGKPFKIINLSAAWL